MARVQPTGGGHSGFDGMTVGQLVAQRPSRARLFEKLGIDYCCGGKRPLREACADKGLDPDTLLAVLQAKEAGSSSSGEVDAASMSLADLATHIEQTHHAYLRDELPRLDFLIGKVATAHGERDPRLRALAEVFDVFRQELEQHMMKEERILFPLIRTLDAAVDRMPPQFHCGSVANPVRMMEQEHDHAGGALAKMRRLTDGFSIPTDACNTYRALMDSLAQLEADMHQHVHKENNVLFPRAIEREGQLAGRTPVSA